VAFLTGKCRRGNASAGVVQHTSAEIASAAVSVQSAPLSMEYSLSTESCAAHPLSAYIIRAAAAAQGQAQSMP
jgi:hypothetical protein